LKGADINTTVVVDPEFMLEIKCTEARASKVFTEGLLVFTKTLTGLSLKLTLQLVYRKITFTVDVDDN
jgi:hypothetical protein